MSNIELFAELGIEKEKVSKIDLFLKLASPGPKTGVSRWVSVEEFVDEYAPLVLGNGFS